MKDKKNSPIGSVGDKIIERTNALTLMRNSSEYFEYYKRGKPVTKTGKVDVSNVSYFLLMRSLELGMKALLKMKEGCTVLYLKNKFKHNVYILYSYCIEKKYLKPHKKEIQIALKMLNIYYSEKDFEYTRIGTKELPYTYYIVLLIEDVHKELNLIIQTTGIKRYI